MAKIDRNVIVYGNDTVLYVHMKKYDKETHEYIPFDMTKATDLTVELTCSKHATHIPIPFDISEEDTSILVCSIDYRLLHTNASYGLIIQGYDENEDHFRFEMLPSELLLVISNTSGLKVTEDVETIDISARVAWGISKYVNADWNEDDPTEAGYIKNKPDIDGMIDSALENYYDKTETDALLDAKADTSYLNNYYDKGETDGLLNNKVDTSTLVNDYYNKNTVDNLLDAKADTSDLNNKQDTLISGTNIKTINNQSLLGSGNIDIQGGTQANWTETDTSDPSYIQNKPDLSIYAQSSNLSTVATSGNYNDLSNKPTIPAAQIQSDWNQTDSSAVDYIKNKPDIPESQHDYSTDYFTIVSLADNNVIGWKARNANLLKTISVSTDDGTTWTSYTSSTTGTTLATLNTGDKLFIKGTNTTYGDISNDKYNYFTSTDNFNVEGNIMSLIYGDNFVNQTTLDSVGSNFVYLFYNCSKLVSSENLILPAITLALACYSNMFKGCTSLTTAPALPATILANDCYNSMFYGCTSLTTAPILSATTLATWCYGNMFRDCTSLNYIKCLATDISATSCTNKWVQNVAASGTFIKDDSMNSWTTGNNGIPNGWNVYNVSQDVPAMKYDIPAAPVQSDWNESNSSSLAYIQNKPDLSNYATTSDLSNKQDTLVSGTNIKTINNQSLLGSGNIDIQGGGTQVQSDWNQTDSSAVDYIKNKPTIPAAPVQSDWNESNSSSLAYIQNKPSIQTNYVIDYSKTYLTFEAIQDTTFTFTRKALQYSLDNGVTWILLSASTASPTVTAGNKIMWKQNNLTPDANYGLGTFSATGNFNAYGNIMSLYYGDNFIGQTDLTGKEYAFAKLFYNNTYLKDASNLILPAKTLSNACYYGMFYGCTALKPAPELPATTLANSCYTEMFYGCTTLTTAPELPAGTLTNYCYQNMFNGCTHLNFIKCKAIFKNATNCLQYWTTNVAASGKFVKAFSSTSWSSGTSGIPSNWTVYTYSEYEYPYRYEIPASPVQSNWNESNSSSLAYIQNKPDLTYKVGSTTQNMNIEVVAALPANPDTNTIYLCIASS